LPEERILVSLSACDSIFICVFIVLSFFLLLCYVVYFVCVCYAMGHAALNESYDDDDDDENLFSELTRLLEIFKETTSSFQVLR